MKKLRVGVVDILGKSVSRKAFSRYMRANNASIMPQAIAVWCAEMGHDVAMAYYDGPVLLTGREHERPDLVFINAYSQTAMLAYALSARYRAQGAVTVLGGPHTRSYPEHAVKYCDYALGFTDRELVEAVLQDCAPYRPEGQYLSAARQPFDVPGVRSRWPYIRMTMAKAPLLRTIPILGSLGCPYTCSFCIDAGVPYQPLDFDVLREDLRFLVKNWPPRALLIWHDPNFGVRFDDYLGVIEEAVPPGSLIFAVESSLSLLKEENVRRLARAGCRVIAPGIESWFDLGDKSKMRSIRGMEKVRRVAEQMRMIASYIPYTQGNFIFGLDQDEGPEPFELTKRFIDLAPAVYPHFSLLTSYGRNAPANLAYQRAGRVLNVPFHFLNQLHALNVRPKHYAWPELYGHIADLYAYAFSWKAIARRFRAGAGRLAALEQVFRAISSERNHKIRSHLQMKRRLEDPEVRRYFEGETTTLPDFFVRPVYEDLGPLARWFPEEALYHDPNAYLKSLGESSGFTLRAGRAVA
ncbi:hypothetical protein GQ464_018210 [Rhodocaloribacter litoris]|uniref:B12-binding domain-containing radical SAM protein n=1 Tax=Rhodocaloribacter litoris TaxID=2558931 RepID=UPI00141ECF9C|nr:radical SAM protein [Rhodocaloribacter litoris]QXD15303.1 hypothetical protein GQ464_018210 [Rhodocaloribacter litoris]